MFLKVCAVLCVLEVSFTEILKWFINILATHTEELRNKTLREMRRALHSQFYKPNTTVLSGACSFRPPGELKLLSVGDTLYDSYGRLYSVVMLLIVYRFLSAQLYNSAARTLAYR